MTGLFEMTSFINLNEKGSFFNCTGASFTQKVMMSADNKASSELHIITIFQSNEDTSVTTTCGNAEPIVMAAIKIPIAKPRCFGNQCDNILTPIG
ncbi:hypothetical protein D9M71_752400 [compost metagenome]